jgi:hypothetical protein
VVTTGVGKPRLEALTLVDELRSKASTFQPLVKPIPKAGLWSLRQDDDPQPSTPPPSSAAKPTDISPAPSMQATVPTGADSNFGEINRALAQIKRTRKAEAAAEAKINRRVLNADEKKNALNAAKEAAEETIKKARSALHDAIADKIQAHSGHMGFPFTDISSLYALKEREAWIEEKYKSENEVHYAVLLTKSNMAIRILRRLDQAIRAGSVKLRDDPDDEKELRDDPDKKKLHDEIKERVDAIIEYAANAIIPPDSGHTNQLPLSDLIKNQTDQLRLLSNLIATLGGFEVHPDILVALAARCQNKGLVLNTDSKPVGPGESRPEPDEVAKEFVWATLLQNEPQKKPSK